MGNIMSGSSVATPVGICVDVSRPQLVRPHLFYQLQYLLVATRVEKGVINVDDHIFADCVIQFPLEKKGKSIRNAFVKMATLVNVCHF
jgi:hypothetical protein